MKGFYFLKKERKQLFTRKQNRKNLEKITKGLSQSSISSSRSTSPTPVLHRSEENHMAYSQDLLNSPPSKQSQSFFTPRKTESEHATTETLPPSKSPMLSKHRRVFSDGFIPDNPVLSPKSSARLNEPYKESTFSYKINNDSNSFFNTNSKSKDSLPKYFDDESFLRASYSSNNNNNNDDNQEHIPEGYSSPTLDDKKSGYALKSAEIISTTSTEKNQSEEKHREEEHAMFELIDLLSRLSADEKIEFALKVCRWNPTFVNSLREELRDAIEKKIDLLLHHVNFLFFL